MMRILGLLLGAAALAACGLPPRATAPQHYDLGPAASSPGAAPAGRPALALHVQAGPALEGEAMIYRLAYADAHQVRAYSQSRWAAPPAELLRQRLRDGLGRDYVVVPGDGADRVLHVELEEFGQIFHTPVDSSGVLRLRASLLQRTAGGEQLRAQRAWLLRQPAPTPDAPGGVRALDAAGDELVQELSRWLQQLRADADR
jgi:cholesterol transport system auxiliary component